jgi:protein-disulfide isomerase
VRFGYQHFAFLGSESIWAAEASECAGDQDRFWEYHDLLFDSQSGENQGAFSKDNLKKLARPLGLDQAAFDQCLDSGKYERLVQDETNAAQQLGVRSTPTFLINGEPVLGAQSLAVFESYFQKAIGPATP